MQNFLQRIIQAQELKTESLGLDRGEDADTAEDRVLLLRTPSLRSAHSLWSAPPGAQVPRYLVMGHEETRSDCPSFHEPLSGHVLHPSTGCRPCVTHLGLIPRRAHVWSEVPHFC